MSSKSLPKGILLFPLTPSKVGFHGGFLKVDRRSRKAPVVAEPPLSRDRCE
jgi:hypothetical protein